MEVALSMICTTHPNEQGFLDGICWDLCLVVQLIAFTNNQILTDKVPLSALFLVASLCQD
jgi:hypothetical protein